MTRTGRPPVPDAKRRTTKVLSQRYTKAERNLIESVADGKVGKFIHDAAVDRARQFADEGVGS